MKILKSTLNCAQTHTILKRLKIYIIPLFLLFLFSNCTSDIIEKERPNTVETWAEDYVKLHKNVDHYLASDFCEMALAGIYNNKASLASTSTDSILFYSDLYTSKYSDKDLVQIVNELEDKLKDYYENREIMGIDVQIFQFKDKLLVLSILKEIDKSLIIERSTDCNYLVPYPFNPPQSDCGDVTTMANAFEYKFNVNRCYLEDIPEEKTNPTPWNYMYMYRNIPNDPSMEFLFTEGCDFTVNSDCWNRIGGTSNGIIMTKCNNSDMPEYCEFTGIPGISEDLMLYLTDYDNYECTSTEDMDIYQERLAILATDLRDANLYGLNKKWIPHTVKFASHFSSIEGIKQHWVTYEFITYGYNPKSGIYEIGF